MHYESPPILLGTTLDSVARTGVTIGAEHLGKIYTVPSYAIPATPQSAYVRQSGKPWKVVVLKNVAGAALKGGRAVTRSAVGIESLHEVLGYANTLRKDHCLFVDPLLGAAGVPDDHYFLGLIEGIFNAKCPGLEADFNGDFVVNGWAIAAASGATLVDDDAGRVSNVVIDGTSATTGGTTAMQNVLNRLGYFLQAKTAATDGDDDVLFNACCLY